MKYSILGFNQEKSVELGLTIKDLLLLEYISDLIASPSMQHLVKDDIAYVWILHDKVLSDLPILAISNRALIDYLEKLINLGLLTTLKIHNASGRGSKTYFAITPLCEELKYDQVQKNAVSRPSAEKCSSDNSINSISNITNNTKQDILLNNIEEESKKENKNARAKQFVDDYNRICQSLPKCTRLTVRRSKGISNLLKNYSYEDILTVFEKLEASNFCTGKNDSGWRANIDFILREDKFVSTLEGRYDDKKPRSRKVEQMSTDRVHTLSAEEKENIIKNGKKF